MRFSTVSVLLVALGTGFALGIFDPFHWEASLIHLRSGIEPEVAIEALIELGRSSVRALSKELELQSNSSLFTGTLLTILGRIAADEPRAIDARTLSRVYEQAKEFVPAGVSGDGRNKWIEENLGVLGIQVRRAR